MVFVILDVHPLARFLVQPSHRLNFVIRLIFQREVVGQLLVIFVIFMHEFCGLGMDSLTLTKT